MEAWNPLKSANDQPADYPHRRRAVGYTSPMSESVSRPVNRVFRSESDMRAPVDRWLVSQGFFTKSEFTLPWGICDVVGLRFRQESAKLRALSRQTQPVSSLRLVQLLELMPDHRAVTVAKLCKVLVPPRSPSQLDADLHRLKAKRLVSFPRRNQIRKHAPWAPLQQRIVAVEMKLHRVSTALAQARAHLAFADDSYVALPYDLADRVLTGVRRKEFISYGVGLLSVRPERVQVVLPSPSHSRPNNVSRLFQAHCAERFWRMWTTGNAASTT